MWYKAAAVAMASMDKPAILQRLRAAFTEGAYCSDAVCSANSS
jgi:hypothetical protein